MSPFVDNKWIPPEQGEVDNFSSKLVGQTETKINPLIQKRLDLFMEETLHGAKRLSDSNANMNKSMKSIASRGVHPVDIILPVYNGLHVLKLCIEAVLQHTSWPFHLTIVDDCSDATTREWLERWAKSNINHTLLLNQKNQGFAATINKGIRKTENPYVCVINSDVIVTPNWLTKMIFAMEADPKNKIVNPITNNTAEISVPMQSGASYQDMNRAFEALSAHQYPEIMPTGFCFLFSRDIIPSIGYFDEGYENYGEETDYWMRTITNVSKGVYARWRAVLADDTYLFHERGVSFSTLGTSLHLTKRKIAAERFHTIWPSFKGIQSILDAKKAMEPYRIALPDRVLANPTSRYNIAFVVYSTAYCGGMRFITDIVNRLNDSGVNAKVIHIKRNRDSKDTPLGELRCAPIMYEKPEDFIKNFSTDVFSEGILVASTNELAGFVKGLCQTSDKFKSVLFAQSDDTIIALNEETKKYMEEAYTFTNNIITNSEWLNKKINVTYGLKPVGYARPGVDNLTFYPKGRENGDERPTLLMAMNKGYPFKGYDRGVKMLQVLSNQISRNNSNIRVMVYGVLFLPECRNVICLGDLPQARLAKILGTEVDVFCDPAHIHTYGLPALEAMVSGAVPVLWDNYGINEYATNNVNSIIVNKDVQPETVANKIFTLLNNGKELKRLKKKAILVNQTREKGVDTFIRLLEGSLDLGFVKKKIAVITPHLRKWGGPTTILHTANWLHDIGHDVTLYSLYPDINPAVSEFSKVPIVLDCDNIKGYDVLISNSDNPKNLDFVSNKHIKKKIMLKLSHNPRFKALENDSLKLPWDAIITSTDWLVDVCKNPRTEEGWDHPSKEATRVGWVHYEHFRFNCPPHERKFNTATPQSPLNICTLAHHHPSKGTPEALTVLKKIKELYGKRVNIGAIGEWPVFGKSKPSWLQYFYQLKRSDLAALMRQIDLWLIPSHTEGLGRLALEAMSSSCAVILTDTGAEFAIDKTNCRLVPVGDVNVMVDIVKELIDNGNDRLQLSVEAYKTACELTDSKVYVKNINKVIGRLFDEERSSNFFS